MKELFFDSERYDLELYSSGKLRPLHKCQDTINAYRNENYGDNGYRKLADDFVKYNECKNIDSCDKNENWYFYKYLKSLPNDNKYQFPLKDGSTVTVNVELLNPYNDVVTDMVDPKWHLLVSYYAFYDAVYNQSDNVFASNISKIPKPFFAIKCKSLLTWKNEAIIEESCDLLRKIDFSKKVNNPEKNQLKQLYIKWLKRNYPEVNSLDTYFSDSIFIGNNPSLKLDIVKILSSGDKGRTEYNQALISHFMLKGYNAETAQVKSKWYLSRLDDLKCFLDDYNKNSKIFID
jgi:hypothetical protein